MNREEAYCKIFTLTKYVPIIMTVAMMVHCIQLYFFSFDSFLIRYTFEGCLLSVATFMYLSHLFKFCWAHRLCIFYNCIMDFCCEAEKLHWFGRLGINVNHARLFMLILGFIAISTVAVRIYNGTIVKKEFR